MKKVMAFGSFDVLHKGHEYYLKKAKSYGDYLVVVVARDRNIIKFKGKYDENHRLKQIRKLDFVDKAVLGYKDDVFRVIGEHKPDVICLGYDQESIGMERLKKEIKKMGLKAYIARAKAYKEHIYKSSKLR